MYVPRQRASLLGAVIGAFSPSDSVGLRPMSIRKDSSALSKLVICAFAVIVSVCRIWLRKSGATMPVSRPMMSPLRGGSRSDLVYCCNAQYSPIPHH